MCTTVDMGQQGQAESNPEHTMGMSATPLCCQFLAVAAYCNSVSQQLEILASEDPQHSTKVMNC
jgi:hypothetical protein